MMTPRLNVSTAISRSPLDSSSSKRHATRPLVPSITQSIGFPKQLTQARIVSRSRRLGAAFVAGCVCRKPTTSPRRSSRSMTAAASNSTSTGAPVVFVQRRAYQMRPRRSPSSGQHSSFRHSVDARSNSRLPPCPHCRRRRVRFLRPTHLRGSRPPSWPGRNADPAPRDRSPPPARSGRSC